MLYIHKLKLRKLTQMAITLMKNLILQESKINDVGCFFLPKWCYVTVLVLHKSQQTL